MSRRGWSTGTTEFTAGDPSGLELTFEPIVDGVRVIVIDKPGSGAELVLSIYPEAGDWIGEQRRLLRVVENRFPAESVEKVLGVWTWLRAE